MSDLPVVDRLASADPARLNRHWSFSSMILSLLAHLAVVFLLVYSMPRVVRGIKEPVEPEARQVGIVLEGESDRAEVYENPEQVFRREPAEEPLPADAQSLDEMPGKEASSQPLPQLDRSVLATTGRSAGPATSLPSSPKSLSGNSSKTTFYNVEATGASFVFIIDRSASMSSRSAFEFAKRELLGSLEKINNKSKFQVIFYNTEPFLLPLGDGKLLEATPVQRSLAIKEINRIVPEGGTNHIKPLEMAFRLRPEVIYYLTDGEALSDEDVDRLTAFNRQASIPATVFAIELGSDSTPSSNKPLRRLAAENDGVYTYLNVGQFGSGAK